MCVQSMVSKQIKQIQFRICEYELCTKIFLKWGKHPLCSKHRICPCSICNRWGKDKFSICKKHYGTERPQTPPLPPPVLTYYDSVQEGSNFAPVPDSGGSATPRNKQGSSQLAQSGKRSTATPSSSSMLSYTRETLSETISNTVPDAGDIATIWTTNKTGIGDKVTPAIKQVDET